VIDQEGRSLEDTVRFPRLHAVATLVRRHDDEAPTVELAMYRPYRTSPADLQGVARMPFAQGPQALGMRRPAAPVPPVPSVAESFPPSFFQIPAFVEEIQQIQVRAHAASYVLVDRVNQRMNALLRRARTVSAAWRYRAADGAGRDLAAAYAEQGTGSIPRITDELAHEIVERAKAGTVAA